MVNTCYESHAVMYTLEGCHLYKCAWFPIASSAFTAGTPGSQGSTGNTGKGVMPTVFEGLLRNTLCMQANSVKFLASGVPCCCMLCAPKLTAAAGCLLVQGSAPQGPLVLPAALDKEQQVWLFLQPAGALDGHLFLSSCCLAEKVVITMATGLHCRCHRAAGHSRWIPV